MRTPLGLLPDGFFHVTAHAIHRQDLFPHAGDHGAYLTLLDKWAVRRRVRILSFCLMDNHLHLIVFGRAADLSDMVRDCHAAFALRANGVPGRQGHVFDRVFHRKPILCERYFGAAMAYVARNPVDASMCRAPEDHRWSAHRALVGLVPPPPLLDVELALRPYGGSAERYRQSVLRRDEAQQAVAAGEMVLPDGLVAAARDGDDAALEALQRHFHLRDAALARALGVHRSTIARRRNRSAQS
jgi:REP element-mobilizing transposase RayT